MIAIIAICAKTPMTIHMFLNGLEERTECSPVRVESRFPNCPAIMPTRTAVVPKAYKVGSAIVLSPKRHPSRLHHRPPQHPGALPRDPAGVLHGPRLVNGGSQPRPRDEPLVVVRADIYK